MRQLKSEQVTTHTQNANSDVLTKLIASWLTAFTIQLKVTGVIWLGYFPVFYGSLLRPVEHTLTLY